MSKSCVICGSEESEGDLLLMAPCERHWICADDVGSFFENATNNESLFPPKCCGQMLLLQDYENYVPFEVAWEYQMKEQGEYAILAKFRVYCANSNCAKFLHPTSHIEDPATKITYAICESEDCGTLTCVKCKALLDQGTENHECKQDEDEKKFRETATEKGYQECFVCGATVELAEACNHITCECGNAFCYICGKNWPGLHGCPHYGPAVYDKEGYNQDGFHRDTGLNRDGLTRRQDINRRRGEEEPDDEEEEEEEEEEDEDEEAAPEWDVLQHLTPDQRVMVNTLPHREREDALNMFRIELFENQGIHFNQGQEPPVPPPQGDEFGDAGGEDGEVAQDVAENAGEDAEGGAGADEDHDDDSDSDGAGSEDEEDQDPLDDGDHFIDEDAIEGERFADDQDESVDIIFDEEMPELMDHALTTMPADPTDQDIADGQDTANDQDPFEDQSLTPELASAESFTQEVPGEDMSWTADSASPVWAFTSPSTPASANGSSPDPSLNSAASYAGSNSNLSERMLADFGSSSSDNDDDDEDALPPTPATYSILARGFAPGTPPVDVSHVVAQDTGVEVLSCTLLPTMSHVGMEIVVASKEAAETVISTFHNKTVDGSGVLTVVLNRKLPGPGSLAEDEEL